MIFTFSFQLYCIQVITGRASMKPSTVATIDLSLADVLYETWCLSDRLASSLIKSVELKICSLPTTCSITCYVWLLRLLSTRPASRPATHYAPLLAPHYTPSASQADAHGFILVFHAFLSLKAALLSLPEQMITHHNQEVSLQLTTRWFQLESLLYRSRLPRLPACTAA